MSYFINLRARPGGGGVRDRPTVLRAAFADGRAAIADPDVPAAGFSADLRGRDVVFAVHGFNVDQGDGLNRLSNWETLLQWGPQFFFVGVLWPGDSSLLGPLCYPGEGRTAMECGKLLAALIASAVADHASTISFVSHSLGARLVLETVRALECSIPVANLALMAGAINDDCLVNEYAAAAQRAGKVSLLASLKDDVLARAFPVGNLFEGILDRGHPYWSTALGHRGPSRLVPNRPLGTYQIPRNWRFGHHSYLEMDPPLVPRLKPDPVVPPAGTPPPASGEAWRPSWSAAFVSARFNNP